MTSMGSCGPTSQRVARARHKLQLPTSSAEPLPSSIVEVGAFIGENIGPVGYRESDMGQRLIGRIVAVIGSIPVSKKTQISAKPLSMDG